MLTLHPGQWARIIGEGKFALRGAHALNADVIHLQPVDHVYAKASVYRGETLVTLHSQRPSNAKSALLTRLDNRFQSNWPSGRCRIGIAQAGPDQNAQSPVGSI